VAGTVEKKALTNRSWGTTYGSGSSKHSLSKEETSSNGNRGGACTGDVDSRKMKLTAIATGELRRPAKLSYRIKTEERTPQKNELPAIEAVMGWRPPMLTENTQAITTGDKHPAVDVEVKASQNERHNNRTEQALAGGEIEKINSKSWWMSKWRNGLPKKAPSHQMRRTACRC
jgi:hypothetical protein